MLGRRELVIQLRPLGHANIAPKNISVCLLSGRSALGVCFAMGKLCSDGRSACGCHTDRWLSCMSSVRSSVRLPRPGERGP